MLAGSSLPVTWRLPELELPLECEIEDALMVGVGSSDPMDYHALEAMQCMVERRRGGETGIKSVQLIEGRRRLESGRRGPLVEGPAGGRPLALRPAPGQNARRRPAAGSRRQRRAAQDRPAAGGLLHRTPRRDADHACSCSTARLRDYTFACRLKGSDRNSLDAVLPHADAERHVLRLPGVEDRRDVRHGRSPLPGRADADRSAEFSRAASTPKSPSHSRLATPHLDVTYRAAAQSQFCRA